MAFQRSDMARVASASTGAHAMWLYLSDTDTTADMAAADYFNGAYTDVRVDDLISVRATDKYTFFRVVDVAFDKRVVVVAEQFFGDANVAATEVLIARSLSDQQPAGADLPIQIEFGAAQGGPTDPVQIDAAGLVTFNEAGLYQIRTLLSVSRTTSGGEAIIFIRGLFNGVQVGAPVAAIIDDDEMTIPLEFTTVGNINPGTTFALEFVRDSAGTNNGGLTSFTNSIGWGTSPSASLRIVRFA